MGIFDFIKKTLPEPKSSDSSQSSVDVTPNLPTESTLEKIGTTESVCPYCSITLEKKPSRKTKCKACGNFIYVRTRPVDRERVLVTATQVQKIEEQWAVVSGLHEPYITDKEMYEAERSSLAQKFGREPSSHDVKWSLLNKQLLEHAQNGDWGLYRNARLGMAELLRKEEKLELVLATCLEVCYIDVNGPRNIGGFNSIGYAPFAMEDSFLAPGVIYEVAELTRKLGLGEGQVLVLFIEIARKSQQSLKLPVSPERAWKQIRAELWKE